MEAGTTWYLNGENSQGLSCEKEIKANGITEHKHCVSLGSMSFALYVQRTGANLNGKAPKQTSYFQTDHLGSIAAITNEAGVVIERLAHVPWGKRRNVNGLSDPNDLLAGVNTERGYTMHEHLDEMGVIHMNGRVYDPAIGRFMSADPIIQSPGNLQSFNRYAYVMNNPLAFTDPSGYFSFKKFFRTVAAIVVGFYAPHFLPGILNSAGLTALASSKIAVGAIAGGLSSSVGAGSLKAFGQGALTGGLFGGAGIVGEGAGMKGSFTHYAAHVGAGCVSAVAGGGKCGRGAASALVGKFVSLNTEDLGGAGISGDIARGVAASVGGLASVAGGGKFSSGAETAAFGYLFNQMSSLLVRGVFSSAPLRNNNGDIGVEIVKGSAILLNRYPEIVLESGQRVTDICGSFSPQCRGVGISLSVGSTSIALGKGEYLKAGGAAAGFVVGKSVTNSLPDSVYSKNFREGVGHVYDTFTGKAVENSKKIFR